VQLGLGDRAGARRLDAAGAPSLQQRRGDRRAGAVAGADEQDRDPALFDVPAGYRAALPYSSGGFDLSRPDTLGNRLAVLWEGLRGFASRWWP